MPFGRQMAVNVSRGVGRWSLCDSEHCVVTDKPMIIYTSWY